MSILALYIKLKTFVLEQGEVLWLNKLADTGTMRTNVFSLLKQNFLVEKYELTSHRQKQISKFKKFILETLPQGNFWYLH